MNGHVLWFEVSNSALSKICWLDFGTVPTVWCFFPFLYMKLRSAMYNIQIANRSNSNLFTIMSQWLSTDHGVSFCKNYMFKDLKQVAYLQETFGPICNDLYQARKGSRHVFVLLGVIDFVFFLDFWSDSVVLFCFPFYYICIIIILKRYNSCTDNIVLKWSI